MSISKENLLHLRKTYCACDDASLCSYFQDQGFSEECKESCESFCKMWTELIAFLEKAKP